MPVERLPDFIVSRKAAFSMFYDRVRQAPYADDASIFRCWALHTKARPELATARSYKQRSAILSKQARSVQMTALLKLDDWCKANDLDATRFHGVPLEQFDELERFLNVNIRVYRYEPSALPERAADRTQGEGVATDLAEQIVLEHEAAAQGEARCHIVYASEPEAFAGGIMMVNVYTDAAGVNHFSYIADLRRFAATHVCGRCHYIFPSAYNLRRHEEIQDDCDQVQHRFPGNGAQLAPTLFARLDEAGIRVDEARRYSPFFAVFDFESCARALTANAVFTPLSGAPFQLPEDDDDPEIAKHYGRHWQQMRTQADANYRYCVLRGLRLSAAKRYAYALAQRQTACFDLRVKLLWLEDDELMQRDVGTFPWIRHAADFSDAMIALLDKQQAIPAILWSIRLEVEPSAANNRVISPLTAVSVAIASNIDGIDSSFLCRRADDEPVEALVRSFVDRLHDIQEVAAARLHQTYAGETSRLAQYADGFTHVICKIFERALADAQRDVAELEQSQEGQVLTNPAVLAFHKARVQTLVGVDIAAQDFSRFHLSKKVKAAMHPDLVTDFYTAFADLRKVLKLQRDLETFCSVLPVFGFNSGTFDLKLIRPWLLPYLQALQPEPVSVLKKNTKYLQVTTTRLRFLDVSNYLAAFTPYAKWIKAYTKGADAKGAWCYDYFERPSQLHETSLPPREAFDSALKGTRCSEAEYAEIQELWRANGMSTLYDYLRYYNLRDVEPFVEALETMRAFWQANGHDMFNNVCTLPGLADRFVRTNFLPRHTNLVLPQKNVDKRAGRVLVDNTDLYADMKRSIVGGPACVYHRLHIAGQTKLRGTGALCQHIVGWDCNGLYLKCSSEPMPTGIPVRYTKQKSGFFRRRSLYPRLQSQLEWLEWMAHVYGLDIRHQFNSSKAPFVAGKRPDGYCVTSTGQRVVFFFDGCRYHGHGGCIANPYSLFPDGMHVHRRQLQDFAIRKALEARGYIVHRFRECDWLRMKQDNPRASAFDNYEPATRSDGSAYDPTLREFLAEHTTLPHHGSMTEAALLREIRRGRFFGTIVCDVEVPESKRADFAEFEPIFKNVTVTEANISPHMRTFLLRQGRRPGKLMRPQLMLVNSFFAKDFVLHTPLARWYLEKGLIIRNVTKAYEYKPKALYVEFARRVAEQRRRADADPDEAIKGDLFKLAGNSIYGKSITSVEKHTRTRVCNRKQVDRFERDPHFLKSVDWLGDDKPEWAEVCLKQKKVTHNLYTPFGSFVYQYAKLRMLQFYYDYIDYYWERKHFQLMYMDTDSFYFALAQPTLDDFFKAVRPERLEQFNANYPEQFLARDDPNRYTAEEIRWDRREVGLFKVETHAKKMLALNPKSYICVDITPSGFEQVQKLSAKGVLRAQNSLTWNTFWDVLRTWRDNIGVSRTLQRPYGRQQVCYISAPKRCLSYEFYKRPLNEDGVTTTPLGL